MYAIECIKQSCFAFSINLKIMDQDCVDATIVSNALLQDTEALESLKLKCFVVHSRKTHSCVTNRIVRAPFQNLDTIRNAQQHAKWWMQTSIV